MKPSEHNPEKENAPGGTEGGEVRKEDATSAENVQDQAGKEKRLVENVDAAVAQLVRAWTAYREGVER